MPPKDRTGIQVVAVNRKARHEYHILETYEAGMELKGSEVKSIRDGGINLKEGYARLDGGELFLEGVHVSPYSHTTNSDLSPTRRRKLLMHGKEINHLLTQTQQKRLTLLPLRVYFRNGRAKLELGLARGKRLYDKRETLRKREVELLLDRIRKTRGPR